MATEALNAALDQIEQALARLEAGVAALRTAASAEAEVTVELKALKTRHRKLKDKVAEELQQLDLLLAGIPK
ncbi:hypothetical protein [Novosphingobium sp. EMRT-2]|uniref:hypothetical protein n=1 Tax=Novosphingobium sp. EMRT-2 TaxID=2571749 RepID=UPI0010BD40CF|nr:hypothetical protein [Novosphingobium sp. EMRT-2]QCI92433.1 hypothetical protein FA702_01915 [Novosphingobium sp. EMRT-2]